MPSKVPVTRQISLSYAFIHIAIATLLYFIFLLSGLSHDKIVIFVCMIYIALSFTLRRAAPSEHRKGMALVGKGEFSDSIAFFEKSYDFFSNHEWVDNFRVLTAFSLSLSSYRYMALVNIAFCYSQTGDAEKSKQYYRAAIELEPDNVIAIMALKLIETFEKGTSDTG